MARVDGTTYSLFGVPTPASGVIAASLQSADYTTTHTTFVVNSGSATFILDFLSAVSPQNYIRQSLPFSYLTISAAGLHGATPSIQIYSDIDNSWTGQFGDDVATRWTYALSEERVHVLTLTPGGTAIYSEVNDMAQWGTAVYCTQENGFTVTPQVGDIDVVRAAFAANGSLDDRDWNWRPGSVIAHSHNLGTVGSPANATFVVGLVTDPAINYMGSARSEYWHASTTDINAGCVHMFLDFEDADAEARTLDATIASKAISVGGSNYSDIVTLSARQVFGAMSITIPHDTLDTNDVMVFVKEISSNGNVNTMDVILPMSPILYVMAPDHIRLLLEPVMQYLAAGSWPHNFTVHDIGTHYPNATGHNNGTAEQMPVEECGNVILLAYMYQCATGDSDWINQYSSLFKLYADYLVLNGLYPTAQLSSDDGAGSIANQTGLVVKAAVALNAYGRMSGQSNYSDTGRSFADALYEKDVGTDPDRTHFTLTQYDDSSWGMEYNLFMDVLLDLNTFLTEAYTMEANYYPNVRSELGVALDGRVDWGKTDWMHFAAATAMAPGVQNEGTRDMFIDDVHAFLTNGQSYVPFSDNFFVETNGSDIAGTFNVYRARPVVGGHFALMALDGSEQM
jgi:hypothetical protein